MKGQAAQGTAATSDAERRRIWEPDRWERDGARSGGRMGNEWDKCGPLWAFGLLGNDWKKRGKLRGSGQIFDLWER